MLLEPMRLEDWLNIAIQYTQQKHKARFNEMEKYPDINHATGAPEQEYTLMIFSIYGIVLRCIIFTISMDSSQIAKIIMHYRQHKTLHFTTHPYPLPSLPLSPSLALPYLSNYKVGCSSSANQFYFAKCSADQATKIIHYAVQQGRNSLIGVQSFSPI